MRVRDRNHIWFGWRGATVFLQSDRRGREAARGGDSQGLLGILLGGEPCQPNTSSMAVASASPQSSSWGSAKRVTARRISEPA